ncbi:putative sterigmatocystin biosynthesis P450 monooxygenase stcS [Colletotrichum trifolii]|uniref:Putative sterigmatocystin biosynthesis P450 monooxygenase stcS n=1 Tax=Colletotrichum trifolii TaxID=5466 RepID=A0A4R8QYE9_COLTR|nr:putative sterigmatocystin biosynthesis P450 monooxygenase stcS [Colletotrichum trifolii]
MFGVSNWLIAATMALATAIYWISKALYMRLRFRGLPQPPKHSWIWAHTTIWEETAAKLPPFTHPQHVYTYLAQKYNMPGIFYVDMWPFVESQVVITDPDAAQLVLTTNPYPIHPTIEKFLRPFTGPDSIAASNGERWKYNHRMVGSGFTPTYVKPMSGMIAVQVLIFHERLKGFAESGEPFNMEEEAAKTVFDVIGKVVFGFSLEAQTTGSPLLEDLRASINPATTFISTRNPWKKRKAEKSLQALRDRVRKTLADEMNERLRVLQDEKELPSRRQVKSVLDRIVLDRIQSGPGATLDDAFIDTAVTNLKALLLGGHGTTTDTFTWVAMFLSLYPDVVARLREEHDAHFSPDLDTTVQLLVTNPAATNDLAFTTAVIKETLRFFPIGFTIRQAPPGVTHLTWNGRRWPVKNLMVVPRAHSTHMDPGVWGQDSKSFRPDRFLGDEARDTHRFAWRPFERGPRACIAQDLAMDELRIMMLLTVRWFDFETVVGGGGGTSERVMYMDLDSRIGDLAFQMVGMEARPRHDMKMKVKLREGK